MTSETKQNQLSAVPVMKINDTAYLLGCAPRTVARMCERGELVACKAGNQWRINRKALMEYMGGAADVVAD